MHQMVQAGTVLAGRYRLEGVVGTGGMAAVWAAFDERLHRRIAVKLVPIAGLDAAERRRFVREARATARFRHPNAVTLFDAGEADGQLFLAMELVDGETLADRLAAGPLPVTEAVRIALQTLAALGAAHDAGVIHRDVKPGNILLDAAGQVRLVDFGIARTLDELAAELTGTGQHVGTPKYFAPELLHGAPPSPASDVYAVGVVLFEMLAGRAPFDATTPIATAMAHVNDPVPDLRSVRPDAPPRLAAAVAAAMAKDPAARYPTAAAMRSVLAQTRGAEAEASAAPAAAPTEMMPAGGWPPDSRAPSRWWWPAILGALAIAGVAAAAVLRDGDQAAAPTTTAPIAPETPAAAAATTATTSTSPAATTTVAPTTTAALAAPDSVEGLISVLSATPDAFGAKVDDVIRELGKLDNGGGSEGRAGRLLERAADWVDEGELEAIVLDWLRPVLEPIADGPGRGNDDDDDDDEGRGDD